MAGWEDGNSCEPLQIFRTIMIKEENNGESSKNDDSPGQGVTASSSLAGVLVNGRKGGKLITSKKFRRYASNVNMEATLLGNLETSTKSIIYEIGVPSVTTVSRLKVRLDDVRTVRADMSIKTNTAMSVQLKGYARKHTNFSGAFEDMDLAAIGYHLAKCIAKYVQDETLCAADILAGQSVEIRAMGIASDPISASDTSVFIPRTVSTIRSPATFAVMAYAANAYGATVYSDVVQVTDGHIVIMPTYNDMDLVIGCFDALRTLLEIYNWNDAGNVMAMAITAGFHYMNTVVGHSDEGGIMRDVLRVPEMNTPYGGIYIDGESGYLGMPIPCSRTIGAITTIVDTILLTTAALVATCDPTIIKTDPQTGEVRSFPTVITVKEGSNEPKKMKRALMTAWPKFASIYAIKLGELFKVHCSGGDRKAALFLETGLIELNADANRHLSHDVISPFYWIEPTSLLKRDVALEAVKAGYGPIANVGERTQKTAFPGASVTVSDNRSMVKLPFHGVRQVPGIMFLQNNVLDGLAYIRPTIATPDRFILPGGDRSVRELMTARESMDKYLWGRGQSMIPHPSECIYEGSKIGLVMQHSLWDDDSFNFMSTHSFQPHEIENSEITFSVNRPTRLPDGEMMAFTKKVKRDRNTAVLALVSARDLMARGMKSIVIPSAPIFEDAVDLDPVDEKDVSSGIPNVSICKTVVKVTVGEGSAVGDAHPIVRHDAPLRASASTKQSQPKVDAKFGTILVPTQSERESSDGDEKEEEVQIALERLESGNVIIHGDKGGKHVTREVFTPSDVQIEAAVEQIKLDLDRPKDH